LLQRLQTLAGVREVRAKNKNDVQKGALQNAVVESTNKDSQNDNSADIYADRGGSLVSEIANLASGAGVELCDVHISEPSLENLFLHHTGRSLRD
jgi:hypothetical protein